MENLKSKWPSQDDIEKSTSNVDLAPYGVITQYAEAVYDAYNKKLTGIVTARFQEKSNGDRTNFCYSLCLSQAKKEDSVQLKIIEVDIADDGWYPANVFLIKPKRENIGRAETEIQLRKFIENAINSDFVKKQIKALLNK